MQIFNWLSFCCYVAFCSIFCDVFSELEIQQFLDLAEENELIVIPLVQTFGHFEVSHARGLLIHDDVFF